jgi:hypothetical protein
MGEKYHDLVDYQYRNSGGDLTRLFQTLLSLAGEIGWDAALGCLERCVVEKRLAWLDKNLGTLERTGHPLLDGYKAFYEVYLGVSIPEHGEIVGASDKKLVTRWWNHCPTLEACRKLGLDTREICKKVYHAPVQVFLAEIDPRLRFARNYAALRPYAPYCEEIITLEESWKIPAIFH